KSASTSRGPARTRPCCASAGAPRCCPRSAGRPAIRSSSSPTSGASSRPLRSPVVDAVGIGYHLGGSLVADYGNRVVLLNVAERSRYPEMYVNLKAELYWGLRDRFVTGDIGGALDELTQTQLASLKYQTPRGLVQIESKEDARKRGVKSPDEAEALML